MKKIPETLSNKLTLRLQNNALRQLPTATDWVDFASNDYIGFAHNEELFDKTGNSSAVTTYCTSCNGKLIARFSVNGFYSFHRFNPEWKVRYNTKQQEK